MPRAAKPSRGRSSSGRARAARPTSTRTPIRPRVAAPATGRSIRASTSYESAATTRRTKGWYAPTVSPNTAILANLATLRDRSRTAIRNDGYAKGAIDKLVSNLIGIGLKPLSQAKDPDFRKAIQELFLLWTDESDADGLLDWYGQQTQAVRAWLEGGEVFIRLRPRRLSDGLSVPLQVQVIEPELCPYTYNATRPNGNRIRAGIEFNGIGKRVAYWFHPSRPGDLLDFDRGQLVSVSADAVLHLFDPLRPGQLRGVPHLTQALIRLHELDKYDDATLLRQQIANLFVGFLKRPVSTSTGETIHPLTGLTVSDTQDDRPIVPLEPGLWQELEPGEDVTFSDPPEVGSAYEAFSRQQLFHVAAAIGIPYEILTGDLSRVNDRTVRVPIADFSRRMQAWQHQIVAFQFCRRIWRAWMDRVFVSGVVPIPPTAYRQDPEPWAKVAWMPHRRPYLHPVQDVQAERDAIRAGFTSRSAVVSEHGEDAEAIDDEQAADNARADELALKYDSDGRNKNNGGTPGPQPPPNDENGNTPPITGATGS